MKHAYFDSTYRDALYSIASDENLLELSGNNSWRDFHNTKPTNEMKEIILASITSSDRIFLAPEEITPKGKLFETQKFSVISYKERGGITHSSGDNIVFPDGDFLRELLRENGKMETLDEILALLRRGIDLEERFERELAGINLLAAEIEYTLIPAIFPDQKVDPIKLQLIQELTSVHRTISGILWPLNYFTSMLQIAHQKEAKIVTDRITVPNGVKVGEPPRSLSFFNGREMSNLDHTRDLFVIVALELGSLPFRKTLGDTLKLADQDDTVALRKYVAEMNAELGVNGVEGIEGVRSDIEQASRKILKVDRRNLISSILNYVGLPMSFAGIVSPVAGAIGIGMSLVGYYTALRNQRVEADLKWAMFGKKPLE